MLFFFFTQLFYEFAKVTGDQKSRDDFARAPEYFFFFRDDHFLPDVLWAVSNQASFSVSSLLIVSSIQICFRK